jgi:hypothetical protein
VSFATNIEHRCTASSEHKGAMVRGSVHSKIWVEGCFQLSCFWILSKGHGIPRNSVLENGGCNLGV